MVFLQFVQILDNLHVCLLKLGDAPFVIVVVCQTVNAIV